MPCTGNEGTTSLEEKDLWVLAPVLALVVALISGPNHTRPLASQETAPPQEPAFSAKEKNAHPKYRSEMKKLGLGRDFEKKPFDAQLDELSRGCFSEALGSGPEKCYAAGIGFREKREYVDASVLFWEGCAYGHRESCSEAVKKPLRGDRSFSFICEQMRGGINSENLPRNHPLRTCMIRDYQEYVKRHIRKNGPLCESSFCLKQWTGRRKM